MNNRSEILGTEPIPKLLSKLSIPAMIGMLVMSLYNVVDTIFIAKGVGTLGVAGVSIAFPLQLILSSIAAAIGIGGSAVISIKLGQKKQEEANHVFGNFLALLLGLNLIAITLGLLFLEPLLRLFGATDSILPYAMDYLSIILLGMIFFAFAMSSNNIVRAEGNAKTAMITMIVSSIINIILDPIFIFTLNMGVKGAAIATIISQVVAALYIFNYFFISKKSSLSISFKHLKLKLSYIRSILTIGSSAFIRQIAGSIMFVAVNRMLIIYGGELGVAVFGMIHKVMALSVMPMFGVIQGLQPIVGFNHGAKQPERVNDTVMLSIKVTTIISTAVFVIVLAFAKPLISIFTSDVQAITMGENALRIIFALMITVGFQMVIGGVYQALGKAKPAFILSMARQVLFLIPLVLLLPRLYGLTGVWLAFPLADLFAFIITFAYAWKDRIITWKKQTQNSNANASA
ncbi:MATE family efflux transporter [Cytobacillus sp. IB215316]|uniref:MATE family efflux transporter n=1 Tax=Cytobacillus sp. IB215316 TaxID=3097354 RepID=UPI002A0EA24B|nr:MATE family efflux transporter [Cytobacillus sp. IB215316]MDX8360207.1 MATE family efflux transporter [Cytobacillus sp. IB215316]